MCSSKYVKEIFYWREEFEYVDKISELLTFTRTEHFKIQWRRIKEYPSNMYIYNKYIDNAYLYV